MPVAPVYTEGDGVLTRPLQLAVSNTCTKSASRALGATGVRHVQSLLGTAPNVFLNFVEHVLGDATTVLSKKW